MDIEPILAAQNSDRYRLLLLLFPADYEMPIRHKSTNGHSADLLFTRNYPSYGAAKHNVRYSLMRFLLLQSRSAKFCTYRKHNDYVYERPSRVEKVQRTWEQEGIEKNSVKDAFELGKLLI